MNIYKHIVYNPQLGVSPLTQIVEKMNGTIWGLHHVQPVTEYEWVAVFEAWDGSLKEEKVFGKKLAAGLCSPQVI